MVTFIITGFDYAVLCFHELRIINCDKEGIKMVKPRTKMINDREFTLEKVKKIKGEVGKVIVGQDDMVEGIIVALLSDGHILLEGYPGLGKTNTVKTVARVLDAKFQRVQFTPDLIPGDITGFELWDPETKKSRIQKGPVFTNLLLADEINRAPAKVQAPSLKPCRKNRSPLAGKRTLWKNYSLSLPRKTPLKFPGHIYYRKLK